ncbi:unnamed protein product [Euphydryas editha]|uniref:Uncharacterized protein n=1 Tax=Euphydryas editha TaxID=104508 RepID=A0AAU9TXY3_EUPED|nr:unnamed protein product [Euphydryas editha]
MSGEPKTQEIDNTIISNYKCRIPQRIPSARPRFSPKSKLNEQLIRPKSANRAHDDLSDSIKMYPESRANRPERERLFPAQKNSAPPINKKTLNEKLHGSSMNKLGRHVITVPVKQETIKKCEDLELKYDYSEAGQLCNDLDDLFLDLNEEESITSKSNTVLQLKSIWQEKIAQFEGMKNELNDRQNAIMEVYASLRSTKQKLTALGQNSNLPSTDDLRVINVANMTPSQLLQLCAETKNQKYG